MALANFTAQELRMFGESLEEAAKLILETCEKMKTGKMESIVLQASAALSTYGPSIFNLAGTIRSEFQDQFVAGKTGRLARWQMNQKKVEARALKREIAKSRRDAVPKVKKPKPPKSDDE